MLKYLACDALDLEFHVPNTLNFSRTLNHIRVAGNCLDLGA